MNEISDHEHKENIFNKEFFNKFHTNPGKYGDKDTYFNAIKIGSIHEIRTDKTSRNYPTSVVNNDQTRTIGLNASSNNEEA